MEIIKRIQKLEEERRKYCFEHSCSDCLLSEEVTINNDYEDRIRVSKCTLLFFVYELFKQEEQQVK